MIHRLAIAIAAAALALTLAPAKVEARPQLIRVWLDAHGSVANGQGRYFGSENGPYVGFGGAVGVQVIVFEAFFDVNVFDMGRDPDENNATMFNLLGGGVNIPLQLHSKVRLYGRANVAYTFAPYASRFESTGDNNGYVIRGGGGVDFLPNRFVAIGAAAFGGYHVFGSRADGDNGSHLLVQVYTRLELGL